MNTPSIATLDALNAVVSRVLPLRARHGALELAPIDLEGQGFPVKPVGALLVNEWALSIRLRCTRAARPPHDGEVTLASAERWDDVRLPAFVEGWLAALKVILSSATSESIDRWVPSSLQPTLPLDLLDEGSNAEEFCRAFLEFPWLGHLLPKRPKSAPRYVLAPRSVVLAADELRLFELWEWIGYFTRQSYVDARWDDAMIKALPDAARALDGVALIHALVGGNGFEVFLDSQRLAVVRHCYESLLAVGATELAAVMRRGIGLAVARGAQFMSERNTGWARSFRAEAAGAWSEVDGHDPDKSYALIESELVPRALAFANRHRDELVRPV